jgi:hypothetical protein
MRFLRVLGIVCAGICSAGPAAGREDEFCTSVMPFDVSKLNEMIANHYKWMDKHGLANFSGRGQDLPPAVSGDTLRANFYCQDMRRVWPRDRYMQDRGISLPYAYFNGADLRGAGLFGANLRGAEMQFTRLDGAELSHANLSGALINRVTLKDADLYEVDLSDATLMSLVDIPESIGRAKNLEYVWFQSDPDTLLELRERYKKSGRRDLERKVTHAYERSTTAEAFRKGEWLTGAARFAAWDIPTRYDLAPTRALTMLFALLILFSFPYAAALNPARQPRIWRILPADRLGGDGEERAEPLVVTGATRIRFALQFSLYSAFQLGWKELNVGSWLARLQRTEYALRGSGWVRTVSGMQSLISVYLLAMWALTQFGRLFEG